MGWHGLGGGEEQLQVYLGRGADIFSLEKQLHSAGEEDICSLEGVHFTWKTESGEMGVGYTLHSGGGGKLHSVTILIF